VPTSDAELVRLNNEAVASHRKRSTETFSSLIDYFKDQSEFKSLSDKSKRAYDGYLELIEAKFGAMPIGAVETDVRAATSKTFGFVLRHASQGTLRVDVDRPKDRGKIAVNVCERGGRLYDADRSEIIWTAEDINQFCGVESNCRPRSCLRCGPGSASVEGLRWLLHSDTPNEGARAQGRQRVTIPVGSPLKAALDAA
jgi:hypothetical protein